MASRFSGGTKDQLEIFATVDKSEKRSKRPFIILGIVIGIFFISTVVLSVILTLKSKSTLPDELCVTPYCVKAANYLIESIDETIEPCEDFYHFVCGTWIKNTRIPDDSNVANTFNLLRTQLDYNVVDILTPSLTNDTNEPNAIINARNLYHSCINEEKIEDEGIDTILSLINTEFGGWPIIQSSSWNNSTFDFFQLLLKLRKYNNDIIFGIGTSIDDKNSTEYDLEVGQSDLGLGQRQYYMNESKITIAYRRFMFDLATALTNETTLIEKDVNDIYEFEKEIAKHFWTADERRNRPNANIRTTIGNLSNILKTTFNFTNYIRSAYASANVTILADDVLHIGEIDYLYNVSSLVDQTSSRVLQNYVIWRFMMHRMDNLPKRFRSIKETFDHVFRGTTTERARTVICGNYVNGNMGFAVSKLYIKKYFDEHARIQSYDMISNIRKSFIDMLEESTWMDDVSKGRAKEKALAIDEKIGYPDYLASDNVTQLETQYAEYVFGSSYLNNVLKLLQIKTREEFQILRKHVDRKAWGFSAPTVVNAFYTPSKNQITFPAGILQMPFFDKDAPKYLNYGGIGVVIGHEMTHGFDNNGRQFDKDGNRVPWWSNETIQKFIERKSCIVEQYSNYTVPNLNIHLNGNQTQGEDIADNGGLREAFYVRAYQKFTQSNPDADKRLPGLSKYSPTQMFFINYAHTWCTKMTDSYALNRILSDVHSLGQFRVIGPTSNFAEFDQAFNCKPGQGNSRVKKCTVCIIPACPPTPQCNTAPRNRIYNPFSTVTNDSAPWQMVQWNSHSNISLNGIYVKDNRSRGMQWSTDDKRFIIFQDGRLQMSVNGYHEYEGKYKAPDAPWVHLLIQQDIGIPGGAKPLSDVTELRWNLDVQLIYMDQHIQPGYDPSLHAGIFPLYMTIQNFISGDPDYGKYFWLGIGLYDDRVLMSPLYVNGDKGTGSLIYSPAFSNFANVSVHSQRSVHVTGDMIPFVRLGLQAAVERGFLRSTDLRKYHVGAMNIGWEVTGLNNGTIEIGNFSLKQYTAQNPKSYEFNQDGNREGWQQKSRLNQDTNSPIDGKWIVSSIDNDIQLWSPELRLDSSIVKRIIINMTNNGAFNNYFQLFWSEDKRGLFNKNDSIHIEMINNEEWKEYVLDLSMNSNWHGIIRRLRINSVHMGNSSQFGIDYIRFAGHS
ncbi:hypothetical protein I4U23_020335 [Adineta vaga]|nr:hypothetical protein I4U23_020335 [Adineta vaga]